MSSGPRAFLAKSGRALAGQAGQAAAAFLLTLVVARVAPPDVRGTFVLVTLVPQITGYFLTGGLPAAMLHFAAREPHQRPQLLVAGVGASALAALVSTAGMTPFVNFDARPIVVVVLLLAGNTGGCLLICGSWYTLGTGRFVGAGVLRALPVALATVVIAIGDRVLAWDAFSIYTAWALTGLAVGVTFFVVSIRNTGVAAPTRPEARAWTGYGLRFAFSQLAALLALRIDQWLVAGLGSATDLGVYSVAVSLSEGVALLATAAGVVSLVDASRGTDDLPPGRQTLVTMAIAMAVAIPLIIFSEPLVTSLFGAAYSDAAAALRILLIGTPGLVIVRVVLSWLSGKGRPGLASLAAFAMMLVILVLDVALIPAYGIVGAAWASTIGYSVGGGLAYGALRLGATHGMAAVRLPDAKVPVLGVLVATAAGLGVVLEPRLAVAALAVVAVAAAVIRWGRSVPLLLAAASVLFGGLLTTRGLPDVVGQAGVGLGVTGALTLSAGRAVRLRLGAADLLWLAFTAQVIVWGVLTATDSPERAFVGGRAWLFIPSLYLVGRVCARNREDTRRLLMGFGVLLGGVFLYGAKQFVLGYTPAELRAARSDRFSAFVDVDIAKLTATLSTNQDFAAVLIVAIPLLTGLVLASGLPARVRLTVLSASALVLPLAVVSMFRTALIACVAGVLVVVLLQGGNRVRRMAIMAVVVCVAGVAVFVALQGVGGPRASAVEERIATLRDPGNDASVRARYLDVWPQVVGEIGRAPQGHGLALTNGPGTATLPLSEVSTPDNGYLTLAFEIGVLGAVTYALWLAAVVRLGLSATRHGRTGWVAGVCAGVAGAGTSVAVAMLAGTWVQLGSLQVLLFPLAGLVVGLANREGGSEPGERTSLEPAPISVSA